MGRSSPKRAKEACSAAPSAPPASPAAGWIQMPSNTRSRSRMPLATQLSATPPAITRLGSPVTSRARRAHPSTASSHTFWMEAAMSISRRVMRDSGWRAGPPKSASKRSLVIRAESSIPKYSVLSRKLPSGRRSIRFSRMRPA